MRTKASEIWHAQESMGVNAAEKNHAIYCKKTVLKGKKANFIVRPTACTQYNTDKIQIDTNMFAELKCVDGDFFEASIKQRSMWNFLNGKTYVPLKGMQLKLGPVSR